MKAGGWAKVVLVEQRRFVGFYKQHRSARHAIENEDGLYEGLSLC